MSSEAGAGRASEPLDTLGMFDVIAALPEQVADAARAAEAVGELPSKGLIENVVVLGMGGSGIAGDVLIATAAPLVPVPVLTVKSYELPAYVGEASLVFAISFSGNTEETLEAAAEAAMQGAKVVAVTSGGDLGALASDWSAPLITVPDSIPQPRAAIGAMAIPPLVVLEQVGLFPGASDWIDHAVGQLQRRRDRLVRPGNEAEELARRLHGTIPLITGGGLIGAAAANRWKCQVNENAKSPAFWSTQPELCHNEVCGWGQHGDITRQLMSLVALRHDHEHPQVTRRFELVHDLVRETVHRIDEIHAEGEGELAQLLDLVFVGDFVSLQLAYLAGVDPGPVPVLTDLKQRLAEG